LDIFELTPTEYLTQNEIDAAKSVRVTELNVQNQKKIEYPRKLVIAKAYIDQLERSKALPTARTAALRQSIQRAESSQMNRKALRELKKLAPDLEKSVSTVKNGTDSARLQALAEILRQLTL
jgi:hypothetical protein